MKMQSNIAASAVVETLEQRRLLSTLPIGQSVSGAIAAAGKEHRYSFEASGGVSVELSLGDPRGSALRPSLQLFAPDGKRVATAAKEVSGSSVNLFYVVPRKAGGIYSVVVKDKLNKHIGAYVLQGITVPATQAIHSNGGTIASGQTVTGTVDHPGGLNLYTFSASAGNDVDLTLGGTSAGGKMKPGLQVFSPQGTRLFNKRAATSSASLEFSYHVPVDGAGEYTVIAQDAWARGTGGFALQLMTTPLVSPVGSTPLINNQPKTDSMTRAGQMQHYAVRAYPGNQVQLTLSNGSRSRGFTPSVQLYGPEGALVASSPAATGKTPGTLTYTVPPNGAGSYTAVVRNTASAHTGAYRLQMSGADAPLPAWVSSHSGASWEPITHTLTIAGPTTITSDPADGALVIHASGANAQVHLAPSTSLDVHLAALDLTDGASLTLDSLGASRSESNHRVLVVGSADTSSASVFNVDPSCTIDLADNDLILLSGGTLPALTDSIAHASDGAKWDGTGLTSSAARDNAGVYALGIAQASDLNLTTFDGQSLDESAVIVKFTRLGDANLNGTVDQTDYARFMEHYGDRGVTWTSGDFDYDGAAELSDYGILIAGLRHSS